MTTATKTATAAKATLTLAERNAFRAKVKQQIGYDYLITEEARNSIVATAAEYLEIQREEFTGHRLTLYVIPKMNTTFKQITDTEYKLSRTYGNAPYNYATDFSLYRLTFACA